MSVLKETLNELIDVHRKLLQVSVEKTNAVKAGKIEALQKLLVQEQKLIRLSEQAERKRQESVDAWALQAGVTLENTTVSNMMLHLTEPEQRELETTAITLTELVTKLKQQEQLNQVLISQSLQFVQLSLDLLSPTLKNMNYGSGTSAGTADHSVFDSRA